MIHSIFKHAGRNNITGKGSYVANVGLSGGSRVGDRGAESPDAGEWFKMFSKNELLHNGVRFSQEID